jgi:hypothetical protein
VDILRRVLKGVAGGALLLGALAVGHLGIIILGGIAAFVVVVGAVVVLSAIFGSDKVQGRVMALLGLILDRVPGKWAEDDGLDEPGDPADPYGAEVPVLLQTASYPSAIPGPSDQEVTSPPS